MNFGLTSEQQMLVDSAKAFVEKELVPYENEVEQTDEVRPELGGDSRQLISFVPDRPGHDRRYAIDAAKIEGELGWKPAYTFEKGIRETLEWYLTHQTWVDQVLSEAKR